MKKAIIVVLLLLCFVITPTAVFAASASSSMSGPGTVRAGDTITVTFFLSGSGIYGASGTLTYDSSQLTLTGKAQKISSPWALEFNGNKFVCYDNNLSSPINSKKAIFTATFKVNNAIAAGKKIAVSVTGITASDGNADISVGSAAYSNTIAAPLSTNANLSALTVSNATLSPAFSSGRTSYSTTVPYDVNTLKVTATKADPGAKVSISGTSLKVGRNSVYIKVTAPSGATKTYTIAVTREQDPNYVPSNNANLASITLDKGILSPGFSVDQTDYIVYLPYEITSFSAGGVAADAKAQSAVGETKELTEGENPFSVTVTAEDGTTKVYTVTAVRMPEYGAAEVNEPEPEPADPVNEPEDPPVTDDTGDETDKGIPVWFAIAAGVLGIILGAGSFAVLQPNRNKKGNNRFISS